MKRDFIHDAFSSFALWFDHQLVTEGQAFSNVSGQLRLTTDYNYPTSVIYSSPYKQWVYDSSISGAQIPSGVFYNNSFKDRSFNDLKLDFQNGRAIFASGSNKATVTAAYSVKDFNIYTTSKSDYELLVETSYAINPAINQLTTGLANNTLVAPCIFLKIKSFDNSELSFGGQVSTNVKIRAVILSDDEFKLNAVGAIFADTSTQNYLLLDSTPLNRYNDIKYGYYNYLSSVGSGYSADRLAFVQRVSFSKLTQTTQASDSSLSSKFPDLYVGFLDFTVLINRWPSR